ncbi:MAG: OmpA family protein, partial [Chitinophagaceae bacterium]
KAIAQLTTDAAGKYAYTLPEFVPLKATASNSGYYKNSIQTMVPADAESVMFSNPVLCLNPITTEAVRVENVYYDYNKATLQEASFPELDKLVSLLNDNPNMTIELGAHTDSKGADAYNLKLSDARANSVVEYLVSKGIDRSRLVAKGYGETSPVAENTNSDGSDNPEGRQQNRRTEFRVLKN